MMDVVLSFDTVARIMLGLLAVLWLYVMAQHVLDERSRARWNEVLVILEVDATQVAEAFTRLAEAAARFTAALEARRHTVGPRPE